MTYASPDVEDDSDRERRVLAAAAFRRRLVDALNHVSLKAGGPDRHFVVDLRARDLAELSQPDRDRLDRLAWKHRRDLPDDVRPRLPPFDPIVREMELINA